MVHGLGMRQTLRAITILLDFPVLLLAFSVAYFLRVGFIFSTDLPFSQVFLIGMLSAAVWIGCLLVLRGYRLSARIHELSHVAKILIAGMTATAAFGLLFYFVQREFFSRLLLLSLFLFGCAFMSLFHIIMQKLEQRLLKQGKGITKLLVIGTNRGVHSFIRLLQEHHSPFVVVAILDGYGTGEKEIAGVPVVGKLNQLESIVEEKGIDAIVQGDNIEQTINLVQFCEQRGLRYYLLPSVLGVYQDELSIHTLEKPLMTLSRGSRESILSRIIGS